jgi:epsilon-lactone hydrolase
MINIGNGDRRPLRHSQERVNYSSSDERRFAWQYDPHLINPVANDIKIEDVSNGRWSAKLFSPPKVDTKRVILFLHGFDLVSKSYLDKWGMVAEVARKSESALLKLDYRVGPEHAYGAAVEDCCSAFNWLWSEWYEPEKICLVGESFGAALALSTLCTIRATENRSPGPAVFLSPFLDPSTFLNDNREMQERDPIIDPDLFDQICLLYKRNRSSQTMPTPSMNTDLRGLPPILIQVGEMEILRQDAQWLDQRARRAWLDVTLEVWPGMVHGWHHYFDSVDKGRQAVNRIGEFLISKTKF